MPALTPDSYETYWALHLDPQTSTVKTEETAEELSVAWFVTGGEVGDELTWPKTTRSLDTAYTAPLTPPKNDRVRLWMVARDHRGGIAWQEVTIRLR